MTVFLNNIPGCKLQEWSPPCMLHQNFKGKQSQSFRGYYTESYKYCIIIAGNNIKISKTHRSFNKILLSLCPSLCLPQLVLPVAFLNGRFFSFLEHSTPQILNVKSDHLFCIVLLSGLKMIFSKFSQLDITACIKTVFAITSIYVVISYLQNVLYKSLFCKFFYTNIQLELEIL